MKKIIIVLAIFLMIQGVWAAGTVAGSVISANAEDIVLTFAGEDGLPLMKSATEDMIEDWGEAVTEIDGIIKVAEDLSDFPTVGPVYTELDPAAGYILQFAYMNRGNATKNIDLWAGLTKNAEDRWSVSDPDAVETLQDQIITFNVIITPNNALAYERVTLNIRGFIVSPVNVVQYDAFANAIGIYNGEFISDVVYGGEDNITGSYVLEADGYNLLLVTRSITITEAVSGKGLVPGSKILYDIVIENQANTVATHVNIADVIPNNCHLFYTDVPTVNGHYTGSGTEAWTFSPTGNLAAGTPISFDNVFVPPQDRVTLSYTVTLD